MKKIIVVLAALLAGLSCIKAQQLSIDNVQKMELRNSNAIKEGSEVKGYYFFYMSDKIDKKTDEYTIQITDNNLKKIKDIKFQDSKDISILESSFNGTDLIFLFYNSDTKSFDYQVYGADGKKKHTYSRLLNDKDLYYASLYMKFKDADQVYRGLYPVEGKGFISNMPSREDKDYTFQIDFFSTEKKKRWTYVPTEGAKRFFCDYLGCFNGVVYLNVSKLTNMLDMHPDVFITGLSLETGKVLFELPNKDFKYAFLAANMSSVNDKSYLYGEYFKPDANVWKDKSLGFAFLQIDDKGAILSEKYCSWESDLGKYLDVNSKGKIADFGYMYVQQMLPTADGSIYAVGEGYNKVANTLGILGTIASQGQMMNVAKLKVTDMILIQFDQDFNVKGAKIYDKNSNTVSLPGGMGMMSTAFLGKMLSGAGEFDYAYSQTNKDNSSFSVCYSDYVRSKDYKGGTFNAISYNDGKITTDKINTKSAASRSYILPAKQGEVLILDYYKKEKRLDTHFEKLN